MMVFGVDGQIVEPFTARPRQIEFRNFLEGWAVRLCIQPWCRPQDKTAGKQQKNRSHRSSLKLRKNYLVETRFNAAAIPPPTDSGLPTAQKCMKNRRGCSVSMWLWSAVTKI